MTIAITTISPDLIVRGSAELRFLGLWIYKATLSTAKDWVAEHYEAKPIALEIDYARALEGKLIAERSLVEMRRFATISAFDAERWLALMSQAFPDIKAKDKLVGVHDGLGGVQFWHNGVQTFATGKSAPDPEFARLFFGVWLHPKTSSPELRRKLIGEKA